MASILRKGGQGGQGAPTETTQGDRTVKFALGGMSGAQPSVAEDSEFLSSMRGQLGSPKAIRSLLAGCTITPLKPGLTVDLARLVTGLVGATKFVIRDARTGETHTVFLAQTARTSFLIYKMPMEELYEIPGLTGAEFKNVCRLDTPKGERLMMSVVFDREIKAIMSTSVEDKRDANKGLSPIGTIAPKEGADLVEFKFKLRSCKVLPDEETGLTPDMDIKSFADSVGFIAPVPAEQNGGQEAGAGSGKGSYILYFGQEDDLYYLYVNSPPASGKHKRICELQYNEDWCVLCRG